MTMTLACLAEQTMVLIMHYRALLNVVCWI